MGDCGDGVLAMFELDLVLCGYTLDWTKLNWVGVVGVPDVAIRVLGLGAFEKSEELRPYW